MGKVLQVRISVAAVRESERLCAVSPVQVPQQEEPAAVSAEIRRDLLRRTTETRADSPHKKEIPMTPVSHGKPCAEDAVFAFCIQSEFFDLFEVNRIFYEHVLKIIPSKSGAVRAQRTAGGDIVQP